MILPRVDPPFAWESTPFGPALVCRALEPWAPHVFTTRGWAFGSRDDGTTVTAQWNQVSEYFGRSGPVCRLHQVHGTNVVRAAAGCSHLPDADIVVSEDPSVVIAVQAADCAPLLFVDRRTGAIAAAHAGWRGMALGVPRATVAAMARDFSSRAEDLLVAAGPSIGACCYEVGSDVYEAFASAGFTAFREWFHDEPQPSAVNASIPLARRRAGHWFFDGWACVRASLAAEGVPPSQIFLANLCTASHPDLLPSYRRDGVRAGRIAAAILRRRP